MISVHNLWKSYGKLQVLKGLSLDVYEGETLVILGRSGVGKSVLLRQILSIEQPDKGTIAIDGKELNSLTRHQRFETTKQMGMLFQGGALFDSMTVGENIAFYLRQHPTRLSEEAIKKRVDESLAMVGLEGNQEKMPSELSGGMRKRAALARMIVYRPLITLYDEPTTGLDPITSMQINELIVKTKKELQATSIVVTHDMRSALVVGDRLAFHSEGKIVHIAPKADFLKLSDPTIKDFLSNAILSDEYLEHLGKK